MPVKPLYNANFDGFFFVKIRSSYMKEPGIYTWLKLQDDETVVGFQEIALRGNYSTIVKFLRAGAITSKAFIDFLIKNPMPFHVVSPEGEVHHPWRKTEQLYGDGLVEESDYQRWLEEFCVYHASEPDKLFCPGRKEWLS